MPGDDDDGGRREMRLFWWTMAAVFGALVAVGLIGAFVAYLMHWMWWQQP